MYIFRFLKTKFINVCLKKKQDENHVKIRQIKNYEQKQITIYAIFAFWGRVGT